MDYETILWGVVPLGAALAALAVSLACLARNLRPMQLVLGLPAVLLLAGSSWLLVQMLGGGWPSFVPHAAIVLALLLVAVQVRFAARRNGRRAKGEG